jgi:putative phosphoesterase
MKIGLISDIHAQLTKLDRALEFLQYRQVDTILCAGDLVSRGQDGDAVVERIRTANIPTVRGNHDAIAREFREFWRENPNTHPSLILRDETIDFLDTLPLTLTFNIAGYSLLLAHGAPWEENEFIYPISDVERVQRVLTAARTDYVILGHTHCPMVTDVIGRGTIINPGAIHGNMDSPRFPEIAGHSCAILSLPDGTVTHYDIFSERVITVPQRIIEGNNS